MNIPQTLFEFIPTEVLEIIVLYLNIFDLIRISEVINIETIISNKYFWINKLSLDELRGYIPYLGISNIYPIIRREYKNVYINDYLHFYTISGGENMKDILSIPFSLIKFGIVNTNINIKNLINEIPRNESEIFTILENFRNNLDNSFLSGRIIISNERDYFEYSAGLFNNGVLTKEEVYLLLIKLTLAGKDLREISNLDELDNMYEGTNMEFDDYDIDELIEDEMDFEPY